MAALSHGPDPLHPIHPPTWPPRHHSAQGWAHEQQPPRTKTLVKLEVQWQRGAVPGALDRVSGQSLAQDGSGPWCSLATLQMRKPRLTSSLG